MPINPNDFRQALGSFATGVSIATTFDKQTPVGITISSMNSLSLTPPLILFCLDKTAQCHETFIQAKTFSMHILASGQDNLARQFAGHTDERWQGISYTQSALNTPHIPNVLTIIDCSLTSCANGGDHTIVIGQVESMQTRIDLKPLLYYRGHYHEMK